MYLYISYHIILSYHIISYPYRIVLYHIIVYRKWCIWCMWWIVYSIWCLVYSILYGVLCRTYAVLCTIYGVYEYKYIYNIYTPYNIVIVWYGLACCITFVSYNIHWITLYLGKCWACKHWKIKNKKRLSFCWHFLAFKFVFHSIVMLLSFLCHFLVILLSFILVPGWENAKRNYKHDSQFGKFLKTGPSSTVDCMASWWHVMLCPHLKYNVSVKITKPLWLDTRQPITSIWLPEGGEANATSS
jgi:hypothetical protein